MNLTIKAITRKPYISDGVKYCWGEIKMGNDEEKFLMPLYYWGIKDYEKQWQEGLERIKHYDTSCLISEFYDPALGFFAFFYALYKCKDQNKLYVLPKMLIKDFLENNIKKKRLPKNLRTKSFNEKTCYEFIIPFSSHPKILGDHWIINLDD